MLGFLFPFKKNCINYYSVFRNKLKVCVGVGGGCSTYLKSHVKQKKKIIKFVVCGYMVYLFCKKSRGDEPLLSFIQCLGIICYGIIIYILSELAFCITIQQQKIFKRKSSFYDSGRAGFCEKTQPQKRSSCRLSLVVRGGGNAHPHPHTHTPP